MSEQPEELFAIWGGQGHRRLVFGLSKDEAVKWAKGFDRECARLGLDIPRTKVERWSGGVRRDV